MSGTEIGYAAASSYAMSSTEILWYAMSGQAPAELLGSRQPPGGSYAISLRFATQCPVAA
eukprot:3277734-Rhodomonas_salina.2